MNDKYLSWEAKAPTIPGLYIRTDGYGKTQLMQASVEHFLDGSRHVYLTDVVANFVRGPLDNPVRETIHVLAGDAGETKDRFLGPIKLPNAPTERELSEASHALPAEPGIYYHSRNLGHGWLHTLVAVSIHRCFLGGFATVDEYHAFDLPTLDRHELKEAALGVIITLALPYPRLNLQMLPA